ncbi:molybdenum cofactor guanylyltransferase MobA [Rhodoplanes sp. TEM]|uniref:Molybdenum cofactor guanylyltransferase n=2 Tax=Nitrobacteraceae TaxID=41294 RepID=A0ABT5J7R3_RHOTP|nr:MULTISPECIES: molybdenum cofactor guanylyltransferase MobA [Rhodoplanes]MDC7785669.1 molybdenum cofactor guanylyltransferase MobA [Rhodoplanes tepidamans]MDC7983310.1 molybdenum cofactor guanylyltransferase MobA [Rhodoplanes sp. TEM]
MPPMLGLVLAGGQAQRLGGGDKGLLAIGGRPILSRVLDRLAPCAAVILSANGDPARFAAFGLPVVADDVPGFAGPLAGVLAGLDWAAAHRPDLAHVLSAPADCPFLPGDLPGRLHTAAWDAGRPLACAGSGGRRHPVVALWPVALRHDLRRAVADERLHKVGAWMDRHGVALAEWPDAPFDPFLNVNTPEDFSAAERIAAAHPHA